MFNCPVLPATAANVTRDYVVPGGVPLGIIVGADHSGRPEEKPPQTSHWKLRSYPEVPRKRVRLDGSLAIAHRRAMWFS